MVWQQNFQMFPFNIYKKVTYVGRDETAFDFLYTVEPRYLELAYFELPLISKWKSGPCFNMNYDNW